MASNTSRIGGNRRQIWCCICTSLWDSKLNSVITNVPQSNWCIDGEFRNDTVTTVAFVLMRFSFTPLYIGCNLRAWSYNTGGYKSSTFPATFQTLSLICSAIISWLNVSSSVPLAVKYDGMLEFVSKYLALSTDYWVSCKRRYIYGRRKRAAKSTAFLM